MNVKELINLLEQCPEDAEVGYYSVNSHMRGHGKVITKIIDVEHANSWMENTTVIAIVGNQ
jgi:hypothetical protein